MTKRFDGFRTSSIRSTKIDTLLLGWPGPFGIKMCLKQGRSGGLVVSVLAFYSVDPSSIPALAI